MWLLRQLGPRYGNEALSGDLFEEYQLDRTRAWYWRQVLAAIWVGRTMSARWLLGRLSLSDLGRVMSRFALSTLLRVATEAAALIGVLALTEQFRQECSLTVMSPIVSMALFIGGVGLSISVGMYLCVFPASKRATEARRNPAILKRLMAVFTITALSAGTLTWAGGNSRMPQQCGFWSDTAISDTAMSYTATISSLTVGQRHGK